MKKEFIRTTMKIEGMMCGMCESHICDTIRKAVSSAKSVSASRKKQEASFITDEVVDAQNLMNAVNATGYAQQKRHGNQSNSQGSWIQIPFWLPVINGDNSCDSRSLFH